MSIVIDQTYAQNLTSGISSTLPAAFRTDLASAASTLTGGAVGTMLSLIQGNVIFTTFYDGLILLYNGSVIPTTTGVYPSYYSGPNFGAWRTDLVDHLVPTGVSYSPGIDPVVLIMPTEMNNLINGFYYVHDETGAQFQYSYERFMFHELAHIATLPTLAASVNFSRARVVGYEPWEIDTIAINAENIIYRADHPTESIIAGHGPIVIPSIGGITVFDDLQGAPTVSMTQVDGADAAVFEESIGGETIRKVIFERGVESRGEVDQELNHYIVNETREAGGAAPIARDGTLGRLLALSAGEGAAAPGSEDSASSGLALKAEAIAAALDALEAARMLPTGMTLPDKFQAMLDSLPEFNQQVARQLSAESSSLQKPSHLYTAADPSFVIAGPTVVPVGAPSGTVPGVADHLPLAASDAIGTVLVGAAGYAPPANYHQSANFTDRLDDLMGSSAGDVLIGGDGDGPGAADARNILTGGDGDDIIVTGSGASRVDAGDGDDLIVAGSGLTEASGGSGSDILAFIDANTAVRADFSVEQDDSFTATQGTATVMLRDIEAVLGTDMNDTLIGDGDATLLMGGAGNDEIHLRRADTGIGGPGVDSFYLVSFPDPEPGESAQDYLETNNVKIADFKNGQDKLYVNGQIFEGTEITGIPQGLYFVDADGYLYYVISMEDLSNYGAIFPSVTTETDSDEFWPYYETDAPYRNAILLAGNGATAGKDQLLFSATEDWDGDQAGYVQYYETLYIDIPKLRVGSIEFTSNGVTISQVRSLVPNLSLEDTERFFGIETFYGPVYQRRG